jgi:hypothetical protein
VVARCMCACCAPDVIARGFAMAMVHHSIRESFQSYLKAVIIPRLGETVWQKIAQRFSRTL